MAHLERNQHMTTPRYLADVTDPLTGRTATLTADSAIELERLVDEHLNAGYPDAEEGDSNDDPTAGS